MALHNQTARTDGAESRNEILTENEDKGEVHKVSTLSSFSVTISKANTWAWSPYLGTVWITCSIIGYGSEANWTSIIEALSRLFRRCCARKSQPLCFRQQIRTILDHGIISYISIIPLKLVFCLLWPPGMHCTGLSCITIVVVVEVLLLIFFENAWVQRPAMNALYLLLTLGAGHYNQLAAITLLWI